jgi:hypothetical protein
LFVVLSVIVSNEFHPSFAATLRVEETLHGTVRGKYAGRRAEFRSHVSNHVAIHSVQTI